MASFGDRIVLLAMRMTRLALYFSLMLLGTTLRPMNTSDLFPLFGNYICEANYSGAVLIISFAGEARHKRAAVVARLLFCGDSSVTETMLEWFTICSSFESTFGFSSILRFTCLVPSSLRLRPDPGDSLEAVVGRLSPIVSCAACICCIVTVANPEAI